MENKARQPVNGTTEQIRRCLLNTCNGLFFPKKSNQRFCHPDHKKTYHNLAYKKGEALMTSRGMHARTLCSPQMKKLLACLSDGRPHTTKELHEATKIENVSTTISELRRCGVNISRAKFVKITETGAKVYQYQLLRS